MNAMQSALLAALKNDPSIQKALAAALNAPKPGGKFARKGKKASHKPQARKDDGVDRKALFVATVVAAFAKLGIVVKPNEDVFTYNRWLERGYKVKTGEKALRVKSPGMNGGGIPLFHSGQVEKIDPATVAAEQAALTAEYGPTAH